MKEQFVLNVIHRPELVPEYIDTDAQEGLTEEGYSFAPNLKIGVSKTIGLGEELVTCLKVEQAL